MLPLEKPPKFIAGIDPYEKGKPLVAILGAGSTGKTGVNAAIKAALMGAENKVFDIGLEYPDPLSLAERVHIYNEENPDQHTTVKEMTAEEIRNTPHLMDEIGKWTEPKAEISNEDRIRFKDVLEEWKNLPLTFEPSKNSTYQIVKDERELQKFIDFLPDLGEEEKYYYSLFARKKYGGTEGLKSDKCQLKRGTTTKERMLRDFKKLEVKLGNYELDGLKINQESLVLYITPNARDMHKAALLTACEITKNNAQGRKLISPQATALNMIQVTGIKRFFNVDVDFTEKGLKCDRKGLKKMIEDTTDINNDCLTFVNTRGGFHILVDLEKMQDTHRKSWYREFSTFKTDLFDIDMSNSDGMLPVCGCVQSEYVPNLLTN